MGQRTELFHVLFALAWVALGIVGIAVLLMVWHPGPFPHPFVANRSTTSVSTTTTTWWSTTTTAWARLTPAETCDGNEPLC